jgi:hypothetical protein
MKKDQIVPIRLSENEKDFLKEDADKMGIGACWIYSLKCMFDTEEGKEIAVELGIKNGFVPMSVGVFGYKTTRSTINSLTKENLVQIIK